MAQAASCDLCGHHVYVMPDGSCPAGHPAEHLTGHYEAPDTPQPLLLPETAQASRGVPRWVWAAGAGVLFFFGLAFAAVAISTLQATREVASEAQCFANQAQIEWAVGAFSDTNGSLPDGLADLVPNQITQTPVCPSDGSYLVDPGIGWVSCSLHGYYGQAQVPVEECETNT